MSHFKQFIDDDAAYLRWLQENPNGFVVNSNRSPSADYLVLHRSSCKHINSPNRANWTTTGYIKTCSTEDASLHEWASREIGGVLSPCGACRRNVPIEQSIKTRPIPERMAAPVRKIFVEEIDSSRPCGKRGIPATISTHCPELDLVWKRYAGKILRSRILIPDTDDDLNWHAFLGHSIDMQGFRAAEFVGVDALTKRAAGFVTLKDRGIGIRELGELWEVAAIQEHLLRRASGSPLSTTLEVLKSKGGRVGGSLADAFEAFPYRKFHWAVRAYLQNSAALKTYDFSFRRWLISECAQLGITQFPATDFRAPSARGMSLELALRMRLERTFYQVGPALAPYMLCDWQLSLWNEGKTAVFANFKLDSFHEQFVTKYGRGIIPKDERGFADWWLSRYPDLPPRLANECIWLGTEYGTV